MMNGHQYYSNLTNPDYESIKENDSTHILDDEFKNYMEILIAQDIGVIPKNYSIEHKRLAAYAYYPPLNPQQLRTLTIDNITSNEVQRQLTEKVYKQLEITFESKIIHWNSIVQTTAQRCVANAVEQAVQVLRGKLLENINNENQTTNIIVQRFVLVNSQLKLV